jgi:tRNA threonylcarbamoyladenosine biosynthesis protein TsaE
MEKITSCFLLFPPRRQNGWRCAGAGNFPSCRSRASANSQKRPQRDRGVIMGTIISHSAEETFEIGRRFAESIQRGAVLALQGGLGAGKTQFVKGLAAGLGCDGPVTSPTYTLVHEYAGANMPVFHFDLYRLESAAEVLRIGFDDYLDEGGVMVIEWPDKFPEIIPAEAQLIRFQVTGEQTREITV